MRHGQAGMDPTDNGEPQSIFDAGAMDYGAPFESTAVSRKQVIEENEKGIKEKLTIVGQDGSTTENSLFRPSKIFGNWFDPANYGLDSDKDTSKSGQILPISDEGNALLAADFKRIRGNLQNRNTDDALAAYEADMANAISKEQNIASRHPEGQPKDESFFGGINNFFEGIDESLKPSYTGFQGFDTPEVMQGRGYSSEDDTMTRPFLPGLADRERTEGYVYPATGSGELANRGEGEAEELFALENPQTWTPEVVEKLLSKSKPPLSGAADRDKDGDLSAISQFTKDQQILANNVTAQESLDLLRQELKALKSKDNYKVNSQESYLDFLRENGVLKDFRPELYKALAGAAFGMLMGQDIDDAFYNSFGAMQAEKDLKAAEDLKFEREKEIENLKQSNKSSGGSFDKSAQFYNIGDDVNAIRVSATQNPDGSFTVAMPDGSIRIVAANEQGPDGKPILKKWYTEQEITKRVQENKDRYKRDLAGIISQYQNDYDLDDKQIEKLNANIVASAEVDDVIIDAMLNKGISFGPNMSLQADGLMTGAIRELIDYRMNDGRTKTLANIFDDTLIKTDMAGEGLDDSTWLLPNDGNGEFTNRNGKNKDVGKMPDKAFADTLRAVERYTDKLKASGELENMDNIVTNRQMFRLAEGRFEQWQANATATKVAGDRDVALSRGYTPFMYWLVSGEAQKY